MKSIIGVCIVTYNQEEYIAQCIDSVLCQQCSEEVRIYVGNDCSTDNTADVCKSYGDKIIFIDRSKNLGLVGNTMALLDQIRNDGCDYVAMLDGDDYWIDKQKLQKEFDYFKIHPEYGLVHTCVNQLYPQGIRVDNRKDVREGYVFDVIEKYGIGNSSVMFKTELLNMIDFEEFQSQGFESCDYVMYAIFASKTLFGFLPEQTAVWRRGIESVSGSSNIERKIKYVQNELAQWRYLAKLFPEKWSFTDQDGDDFLHWRLFNIAFRFGDRKRALQEVPYLKGSYRKKNRIKIIFVHSRFLMLLWNVFREKGSQ